MLALLIFLIHLHWQTAFKKYPKHYTAIKMESEEHGEQRLHCLRGLSDGSEHLAESRATAETEEKSLGLANRVLGVSK